MVILISGGLFLVEFFLPAPPAPASTHAGIYAQYAGSADCRECHATAYASWAKSYHALAERSPDPRQEDAAFLPERTFRHGSQQTTLRATNGQYQIITSGLSGTNEIFPVVRVLAENPLRQMLVSAPGNRLQVTEAAWDPRLNEWFNVFGIEDRQPGEWGHWLGRGMNWNCMCATCHNTHVLKNYDATADTYHTTLLEHGVGCESCHGPARAHSEWQRAQKKSGIQAKDPTLHKLNREDHFNNCAGCHSRRAEITGDPTPGENFFDHHLLTIVDDSSTFYPDGQIWDEDYELAAFMGSKMYHAGVRCLDCHDGHTMKTRAPGNFLCLNCHGPGATNAPSINPVTHSHHRVFGFTTEGPDPSADFASYRPGKFAETGGECVSCHMPTTPYMQRHYRHDHGFTIPDPLLTKQFNIPNACERCHADKGTDWNLKFVAQWYGTNMNRYYRQRAQTIARARLGEVASIQPLIALLQNDAQFYWRAVAAGMLQRWCDDPAVSLALLGGLRDTNALVRQVSAQALGPLAQAGRSEILAALQPLLKDPARNVRVETARQLAANLDTNSLAGREYIHLLNHIADQPLGQIQRGSFLLQRGDVQAALPHFQTAARWDTYSPGIRHELAIVLSQLGRHTEAVKELETAVKLAPNDAEFHYKLALALNETGNSIRVLTELETAVKLDPRHARAAYNLGLARQAAGDSTGAIQALLAAENAEPRDARIPYARATVHAQLGQFAQARAAAERALRLEPNFPPAAALLRQLP